MAAWVDAGPSPWLIGVPLAIGALIMTFFSGFRISTVHFREQWSSASPARLSRSDGLERAIAPLPVGSRRAGTGAAGREEGVTSATIAHILAGVPQISGYAGYRWAGASGGLGSQRRPDR
ncbi:MAG: hypothetical protein R2856_11950 [Caldilineaceae bacterium]